MKLDKFDSFISLLNTYPEKLGLSKFKSNDEWIEGVRKIYSVEKEKKYGVLAIHIEMLNQSPINM